MRHLFGLARILPGLLYEAFREWQRDNVLELGAALAYYTVFSIAPLLVIVIAVAGLVFGREAASGEIFAQFRGLMGADSARALEVAVQSASRPASGVLAIVIGIGSMMLGARGVFGQLRNSLNRIWHVETPRTGWRSAVRSNLLSFAMVFAVGFLLIASLVVSAGLSAFERWASAYPIALVGLFHAANVLVSFGVITLMFAMMFRLLPDVHIGWRDVWIGAAITSLLFGLGKEVISFYITRTHFGAAYGVAGSILVVLGWIYYSAQIFFFGAECTEVYAKRHGSGIRMYKKKPRRLPSAAVAAGARTGSGDAPPPTSQS